MASDEVPFPGEAEWPRQFAAFVVDMATLAALLFVASLLAHDDVVAWCIVHLLFIAYRAVAHLTLGRTAGTWLLGLKVVPADGEFPSLWSIVAREGPPLGFTLVWLGGWVMLVKQDDPWLGLYLFVFIVGPIWLTGTIAYLVWVVADAIVCLLDGRTLHDDLARTRVVERDSLPVARTASPSDA